MQKLMIQRGGSYEDMNRIIFTVYSKGVVHYSEESGVDTCDGKQERLRML